MRNRAFVCGVIALVALPGCYLFHTRDEPGGSSADAGATRLDVGSAGVLDAPLASPRDAAVLTSLDVSYPDSGPPLPPEPEPDPGPDGRPSDDPDGWVDPPDVGAEEPCCTLGEPIRLASRPATSLSSDPPLIAWRPGRWAIAVTEQITSGPDAVFRLVVYELEEDGTPIGAPRVLDAPPMIDVHRTPVARALRWGGGRWAFAASGDPVSGVSREMHVRLFDRELTPASDWQPLGEGTAVDVAYLARGDRWLAFTSFDSGLRTTPFDERSGAGTSIETPAQWAQLLRAATFASRAAAVPISAESEPELVVADPSGTELGRVSRDGHWVAAGGLAALRDIAVVAVRNEGRIEVEVLDPFALRRLSGPSVVAEPGPADDSAVERSVDVAGSSKFGVAGVCWGVPDPSGPRGGNDARLELGLVGPDGLLRGAPVTIVTSSFRSATGCTVATDERGFLVGWYDGSELWVRRVDVRD